MANTIPKRNEVPEEFTWNLKDIFESDEAWMAEYEALKAVPAQVAAYAGRLGESAAKLLQFLKEDDELSVRLMKLYGYASCSSDQDAGNGFYQDMMGKARNTGVAIGSAGAFATPEIMAIPDETLERFYAEEPELEVYRRSLYKMRRGKEHILSTECEALLAASRQISSAPNQIGSIFRNADMRYPDVTDDEGNVYPLTDGSLVPLLESPDPAFRRKVFEAYYNRLGEFRNTCAATLDAEFKQRGFYAKVRKYPDTLTAALDRNEVPVEVYTNLIEAVHGNLDKMHRYVALRKKMLGLSELRMSDIYAPIVADAAGRISFEQAKENVLEALAVLGEDYVDMLKEAFANRWIDVYENVGKRSGAYSSGFAKPHPYVLLNHKDTLDSEFTLAHEMGHALHSYLSMKNQPENTSNYVIFVAEVASTCNEILLMRHLLGKTDDKKERAYLINHFLDQFKGTIYRQTQFAEFELFMGRSSEAGAALTADMLCKKYRELNEQYYGPDMVSDECIATEWARIPHFFMNYYVFQYATGFSAAVAIANRILSEGESAVADYKRFLSSGCSADPISLLKIAGVDMSTPAPVNEALKLFDELLDEMEKLV